jgi:formylglycine-generating enzyme required for sulfatase activity
MKPDDAGIIELRQVLGDVPNEFGNSLGMKFVRLPAGNFWMGDRTSQEQVAIANEFYLAIHPVTQGQWQAVMGTNPSFFSRSDDDLDSADPDDEDVDEDSDEDVVDDENGDEGEPDGAGGGAAKVKGISDADLQHFPVERVSWEEAQEFIKKLNAREQANGILYRLPTDAEWEYACREGGSSQQHCAFDFYLSQPTNDLSSDQANFDGNHPAGKAPEGKYLGRTTRVGSYKPNQLGIYDLHGNVWEWCEDFGNAKGTSRVIRGGSWSLDGSYCRASNFFAYASSDWYSDLGFRLAAVPSGE